jgi:ABC-type multidrug transport system fused ATPase/permease subunit
VNKCSSCGCSSGTCQPDESCRTSGGGGGSNCDNGDKQCSGNILQVCLSGNWKNNETCANGCNSTTLICNSQNNNQTGNQTVICNTGEKKCSDNLKSLLTCEHNSWNSESCENGCLNNECKSSESKIKEAGKNTNLYLIALIAVIAIIIIVLIILTLRKNKLKQKYKDYLGEISKKEIETNQDQSVLEKENIKRKVRSSKKKEKNIDDVIKEMKKKKK